MLKINGEIKDVVVLSVNQETDSYLEPIIKYNVEFSSKRMIPELSSPNRITEIEVEELGMILRGPITGISIDVKADTVSVYGFPTERVTRYVEYNVSFINQNITNTQVYNQTDTPTKTIIEVAPVKMVRKLDI